MSDDICVKFWIHTSPARAGSDCLEQTLRSLRESDIGDEFEVCLGPPASTHTVAEMNQWWMDTLLRKATESTSDGGRGYVVRFEDDIIVNRHILHNVKTWPALGQANFGMGDLFNADSYWPERYDPMLWRVRGPEAIQRLELDQQGGQGQLFASAALPKIMKKVERAGDLGGGKFGAYDFVVSRACNYAGFGYYAHLPSLVNCHDGCKVRSDGVAHDVGHYSDKNFDLNWKRKAP